MKRLYLLYPLLITLLLSACTDDETPTESPTEKLGVEVSQEETPGMFDDYLNTNRDVWQKLRLVVVHSTEVYIPLEVNKSPFNVGLPVELTPFTPDQITTLAQKFGLDWSSTQSQQLNNLVGGQPYLVKKGLYHLWRNDVDFEELLNTATSQTSIYAEHLQWQQLRLQRQPELATAFTQVLEAPTDAALNLEVASLLQSLGLVTLNANQLVPSCKLYEQFFRLP